MKHFLRLAVLVGVATLLASRPAEAGYVSVNLSAGVDGSSSATSFSTFNLTTPNTTDALSVVLLGGDVLPGRVGTAGGEVSVTASGAPVTLDVIGGTGFNISRAAYVASANAPADVLPQFGLAPVAPVAGVPSVVGAPQFAFGFSGDGTDGGRTLLAAAIDADGTTTGVPGAVINGDSIGSITVPKGGWWAAEIWPEMLTPMYPVDPVDPAGELPGTPGPVMSPPSATPEPATLVLVGLGLPLVGAARRLRRKK